VVGEADDGPQDRRSPPDTDGIRDPWYKARR
jgi:hypothetical protein